MTEPAPSQGVIDERDRQWTEAIFYNSDTLIAKEYNTPEKYLIHRAAAEELRQELAEWSDKLEACYKSKVKQLARKLAVERARADAMREACAEAIKAIDEAYAATGHFKVAKTSEQRLRIESAMHQPERSEP